MKITSVNNDLIKETAKLLKSKYREESGLFLIEGEKGVAEAIREGLDIKYIFTLNNIQSYPQDKIIETTEAVMAKISDTKSAPKVIAVAEQVKYDIERFKNFNKIVLLEDIKDAGNLGTILRTACAFGVDGIVLFGDTVDLYNPKCVRSAVGNLWKIPVVKSDNISELNEIFKDFEKIATLPAGTKVIKLADYQPEKKTVVMFGSEANGLSKELKSIATKNVTIEMAENVESLNLSVSAAVFMYKIRR